MRIGVSVATGWLLLFVTFAKAPTLISDLGEGQDGLIYFQSVTPDSFGQLAYDIGAAPSIAISGTLLMPTGVQGKVPAMVVKHGAAGVTQGRDFMWAEFLNALGVAAFIVDSYTERGIVWTGTEFDLLTWAADIADALFALKLLSTHPGIDPDRIGVMGFSRGGGVALSTGFEEYRRAVIEDDLRFAVHIPLYPGGCSVRIWSANISDAPMLMLLGELDEAVSVQQCVGYAEALRSVGAHVTPVVYSGAYHAFDNLDWDPAFNPDLRRRTACRAEVRLDTREVSRYDTGEVFESAAAYQAYLDTCTEYGYTSGGDPNAHARAKADIQALLQTQLALPSDPSGQVVADLTINGSDGPVTLQPSDTLSLQVNLEAEMRSVTDYWLAATTPFGVFFYTARGWTTNVEPVYQGPLVSLDLELFSELPLDALPPGRYGFYFGIDTLVDGELTAEQLAYDGVVFEISL